MYMLNYRDDSNHAMHNFHSSRTGYMTFLVSQITIPQGVGCVRVFKRADHVYNKSSSQVYGSA